MKRKLFVLLAAMFALSAPMAVFAAMEHGDHGKMAQKDQGEMDGMKHGEHGGMEMHGDMVMLGEKVENGVKAMAHLKDVGEAMAKMNMPETHHFMVMFVDTETGDPIEEGLVAVKITTPSGETRDAVKLMGMQGHFGADVALQEKGEYKFAVGSKLKDGEKRSFDFSHTVK